MRRFDNIILKGTTTEADVTFVMPNRCKRIDITNPSGVTSSISTMTQDSIVTFSFAGATSQDITRISEGGDTRDLEQNTDERILEDTTKIKSYVVAVDYVYNTGTETENLIIMQVI
jgi:hypothetical protein